MEGHINTTYREMNMYFVPRKTRDAKDGPRIRPNRDKSLSCPNKGTTGSPFMFVFLATFKSSSIILASINSRTNLSFLCYTAPSLYSYRLNSQKSWVVGARDWTHWPK